MSFSEYQMNFPNNSFKNTNNFRNSNYISNFNNFEKSQEDKYQMDNNFEIKKLIKEQFDSFIAPYRKDINNIKSEINNIYKYSNKGEIKDLIGEIRIKLNNFVDKEYLNQKMDNIESKIGINKNYKDKEQKVFNNIIGEINKIKGEINDIKLNNNNLNIKLEIFKNNLNDEPQKKSIMESNIISEVKLKNIVDRNDYFEKYLQNLKDEFDSFKTLYNNSIIEKEKKFYEFEFKYNNLKNSFNELSLIKDIKQIKDNMKKIKDEFNNLKDSYDDNFMNLNQGNKNKINELIEKYNLSNLSKFNIDKYNTICNSYEKLMINYINLAKIIGHHNNNLSNLNNKLDEIKLSKNQIKKESSAYNEDLFLKKYEILDRQIQYIHNRVEKLSIELMNINFYNILLFLYHYWNMRKNFG